MHVPETQFDLANISSYQSRAGLFSRVNVYMTGSIVPIIGSPVHYNNSETLCILGVIVFC